MKYELSSTRIAARSLDAPDGRRDADTAGATGAAAFGKAGSAGGDEGSGGMKAGGDRVRRMQCTDFGSKAEISRSR
ncbi:MAG: hypothetical protein QM674_03915 [Burkholderiaceae bacterium]